MSPHPPAKQTGRRRDGGGGGVAGGSPLGCAVQHLQGGRRGGVEGEVVMGGEATPEAARLAVPCRI